MISKTDLLIKMGVYIDYPDLLALVEKAIVDAAADHKFEVDFSFKDLHVSKNMIDSIYMDLAAYGYTAIEPVDSPDAPAVHIEWHI